MAWRLKQQAVTGADLEIGIGARGSRGLERPAEHLASPNDRRQVLLWRPPASPNAETA